MEHKRKVKVLTPMQWSHHRTGWGYVVKKIHQELHADTGTYFYTNGVVPLMIENYKHSYKQPWLAIMHVTPSDHNLEKNMINNKRWHESLNACRGMFTLSNYSKTFLEKFVKGIVPVETLLHPLYPATHRFSWEKFLNNGDKRLYFLGHWRRNFEFFYKLNTYHTKTIIRCTDKKLTPPRSVKVIDYLSPDNYDRLFENNICFLCLDDASANNTVLECISSNTPLIINRLPSTEEYLGASYPLFYNDQGEAESLLKDLDKIQEGHEYLLNMDKSQLTIDNFINSLANSPIYQKLNLATKLFL